MSFLHSISEYFRSRGSFRVQIVLFLCLLVMTFFIRRFGWMGVLFFGGVLPGILFVLYFFHFPRAWIYMIFIAAYLIMGFSKYIQGPWGIVMDGLLGIFWTFLLLRGTLGLVQWNRANNLMTWLAIVWFLYLVLQLFNPLAPGRQSWIYGVRGLGLYFLFASTLSILVFDQQKGWVNIVTIWGILSLFAALKAFGQKYIGFDPYEYRWLYDVGARTHLLSSGIRYFSIFTDAGQFGASMGHSGTVFFILFLNERKIRRRIFYFLVFSTAFWAMGMSGTRGAIAVPMVGLVSYVILCKNFRLLLLGSFLLIASFVFFRYTMIGQGYYEIRRMRSAFFPTQDASLSVRMENQKKLAVYLQDKPFGTGLGTAGANGARFYPDTFVATIPPDSWYVLIWAETGIVGLLFYLSMMFVILAYGSLLVLFKIRDKQINNLLIAFISGGAGILVASYGNAVVGQFPTNILYTITISYIFVAKRLDATSAIKALPPPTTAQSSDDV